MSASPDSNKLAVVQIDTSPQPENMRASDPKWLWHPIAIVFLASACIMVLELVAGRIIAPYVGVSLYTWTSVIGVVLAGISLGNFTGGKLADKRASLSILGAIFLFGGLASMGILGVDLISRVIPENWSLLIEILVMTTILFFIPCFILGMISPVVVKLAVKDLAKTGSIVGKIYAAGALGSILGTFATGFWLISWFGTYTIIWGVAILLILIGLLMVSAGRWKWMLPAVIILGTISLLVIRSGLLTGICTSETNYFCIRVHQRKIGEDNVLVLRLDRLVHSYTIPGDPTALVYGYEKIYAEATAYQSSKTNPLAALFIGGGGYTFPRYMEAIYPNSKIDVIEIDPGVTEIAHELLELDHDTRIETYNEDARIFMQRQPKQRYDLIFGDAFNDFSVPYHLTTLEFNQRVKSWLEDEGMYVVNIIDGPRGEFVRSYVHTLQQSFSHVYLVPLNEDWEDDLRSTFVVISTEEPLQISKLATIDAGADEPELLLKLYNQQQLTSLLDEKRVVLLTDQYAPVDQMLAPIFGGR